VSAARGFGRHGGLVRRVARASLRHLGEVPTTLSVALVDEATMQDLNRRWRGKDRPTDVLAFAQREGEAQHDSSLLGDVVISVPTAQSQAAARGRPLDTEITELLVHGILHLLGYDHERSPAEARRMRARTREILRVLRG
jgi:rRNA maturation RNase YbeY